VAYTSSRCTMNMMIMVCRSRCRKHTTTVIPGSSRYTMNMMTVAYTSRYTMNAMIAA